MPWLFELEPPLASINNQFTAHGLNGTTLSDQTQGGERHGGAKKDGDGCKH